MTKLKYTGGIIKQNLMRLRCVKYKPKCRVRNFYWGLQ